MKQHSTNYYDTFIQIAVDCPVTEGEAPPRVGNKKTVANFQYDLLKKNPYRFTSDDILFNVFAERNGLSESEYEDARIQFFSKGQPCFRASALTKRYGWGIHSNNEGKIALYGCETAEYEKMSNDNTVKVIKAMKTSR